MPRIRYLKPDFFIDEELAALPHPVRLLFQGLWLLADREGRLGDRPNRIKLATFPWEAADVDGMLWALVPHFIARYEINGRRYIQVVNFEKHQKPHKHEADSTIPRPDSDRAVARAKPLQCPSKPGHVPASTGSSGASTYGDGDGDGEWGTSAPPKAGPAIVDKPVDKSDSQALELCGRLRDLMLQVDARAKVPAPPGAAWHGPGARAWYAAAERLLRIDKRSFREVAAVMDWGLRDGFWRANILSMPKLRQKFPMLRLQYLRKTGQKLGPWCEACGANGAAGKPTLCGGCRHCKLCGQDQKPLKIGRRPDGTKVAVCRDCRAGLAPPPPAPDEHDKPTKPRPGKVDAQEVLKGLGKQP